MATGYVTYGVSTGNWGLKAVYSGLAGAAMSTLGYVSMGLAAPGGLLANFSVGSAIQYSSMEVANIILSNIVEPITIFDPAKNGGFGLSLSPIAMFTGGVSGLAGGGFRFGAGINVSQKIGDWTLGGGISSSGFGIGNIFAGASYDDGKKGFSYYHTWYMQNGPQRTGTIGGRIENHSLRWENDLWGDGNDRYRSHAMEYGYKNFLIGSNVYTNQVKGFKDGSESAISKQTGSIFGSHNTWVDGEVYSSPLYIGAKGKHASVTRVGINTPIVADLTQNFAHLLLGGNFFPRGNFRTTPYFQTGVNVPYTLY